MYMYMYICLLHVMSCDLCFRAVRVHLESIGEKDHKERGPPVSVDSPLLTQW